MKELAAAALSLSMAATTAAHAQGTGASAAVEALSAVSPALEAYTRDELYGDVWQREDLSVRDRSLVTVGALIARNQVADMPTEFSRALENGVTPAELSETITHLAFYAGWPNVFSALPVARDVFEARAGQ